jgi:arylsulfatase A-like enzyme
VDLNPKVGERGFVGTLAQANYRTAFIGKAHFATKATFQPTGTPECKQSGAMYGPDWFGPYMGFRYVELVVLGHFHKIRPLERPPVGHYERWFLSRGQDEEAYRLWAQSLGPDVGAAQTWYSALPAAWHSSTWIADRTCHYLEQRDRTQPFCDALGLMEDTLIVFTTDHGELLGNHGLYLKGPTAYEDLLRVGLIAKGPGVTPGQVVAEPVSTLDLAATFYEYAGVVAPHDGQGRSLCGFLTSLEDTRDVAYDEWYVHPSRCGVALRLHIVRTKTHKCTFELTSGAGELYDLVNDPGEMDNRYDDPACAGERKELEEMMWARPGPIIEHLPEPVGMA